jgi:hypothetical protein
LLAIHHVQPVVIPSRGALELLFGKMHFQFQANKDYCLSPFSLLVQSFRCCCTEKEGGVPKEIYTMFPKNKKST